MDFIVICINFVDLKEKFLQKKQYLRCKWVQRSPTSKQNKCCTHERKCVINKKK